MGIFDVNRVSIHKHININKNSSTPWYGQLAASSSNSGAYATTTHLIEYYDAKTNSIKSKKYDCIKLEYGTTLTLGWISSDDLENNYMFLKYYYVKYDGASSVYRWQYSNIDSSSTENYTPPLGIASQINAEQKTAILPPGEYGLNGWEIVKISKNSVDYYYQDSKHIINCKRDNKAKVKESYTDTKVIRPNYVGDMSFDGYTYYSIPAYGINSDCIRICGDMNKTNKEGNFQNKAKTGIQYYYYDRDNIQQNKGTSYDSLYFREADPPYPIALFNDFCWGSEGTADSIPSSSKPLKVTIDENKTSITISFGNKTKKWKLYEDDRIIFYTREPQDPITVPTINYATGNSSNKYYCCLKTVEQNNFTVNLNNIKLYDFYNVYKKSTEDYENDKWNYDTSNNIWTLKDNISYEHVSELSSGYLDLYKKIIINGGDYTYNMPKSPYKEYKFTKIDGKKEIDGKYCDIYQSNIPYNTSRLGISNNVTYCYLGFKCNEIRVSSDGMFNIKWMHNTLGELNLGLNQNGGMFLYIPDNYIVTTSPTITEQRVININNIQYIPLNSPFHNNKNMYNIHNFVAGPTEAQDTGYNVNYSIEYKSTFKNEIYTSIGMIKSNKYLTNKTQTLDYQDPIWETFKTANYDSTRTQYNQEDCETRWNYKFDMILDHTVKANYYGTNTPANINQPAIAIVLWTSHEDHTIN